MTHDPLCPHDYTPYHLLGENSCQCELIAKVRADERNRAEARDYHMPAWSAGFEAASAASTHRMIREDALQEAIDAVQAVNPGVLYRVDGYQAVAAIESLRGQ